MFPEDKYLTLIVPTFNMGNYLGRCLSSICVEEVKEKVEILVVNDGSTDNSLAVADEYAQRMPGICHVIDKKNGNYGSCINAALPIAKGKYVKIVDADDSFDTDNYISFVNYLSGVDTDVVISDFVKVDEAGTALKKYSFRYSDDKAYPIGQLTTFDEVWMHMIAYKAEMLRKIGYHQSEGISYTDQEWIFLPVAYSSTFSYFPKVIYRYTCGRAGQTVDPEVFTKKINDEITGFKSMLESYSSRTWSHEQDEYLKKRLLARAGTIYSSFLIVYPERMDIEDLISLDSFIQAKYPLLYQDIGGIDAPIKIINYKYILHWRKSGYKMNFVNSLLHRYKIIRRKLISN